MPPEHFPSLLFLPVIDVPTYFPGNLQPPPCGHYVSLVLEHLSVTSTEILVNAYYVNSLPGVHPVPHQNIAPALAQYAHSMYLTAA